MSCVARTCWAAFFLAACVAGLGCDPGAADAPPKSAPPEPPLVEVTPRAVESVRSILDADPIAGPWALRLTASWPTGICSPQHKLDIDPSLSADDHVFESGSVRVVVLKRQVEMFRGARVDFGEENGRRGFIVTNPNFEGDLLTKWGPVVAADPLSGRK